MKTLCQCAIFIFFIVIAGCQNNGNGTADNQAVDNGGGIEDSEAVDNVNGTDDSEAVAEEVPDLPAGVTEEEYLDQKVFREIHGLETSDEAILRALDQNYRLEDHSDHDVRLTAEELKIVNDIDSMTAYMEEVRQIIEASEDEYSDFASLHIDTASQGIVHVNIKEDLKDDDEVQEIVDEIKESSPIEEKINISYVEFSEAELRQRQEEIVQDDKFSEFGINLVSVRSEKNTILIGVEELNPEIEANLKERYGEDIQVKEREGFSEDIAEEEQIQ